MNPAKIAEGVQKKLAKVGRAMTLSRLTVGAYSPDTGTATNISTAYACAGIALNYSALDIDGTLIRQGDQRVYAGPLLEVSPLPGDTLAIGGEVFTVVASKPLNPSGTVLLHDLQVRAS